MSNKPKLEEVKQVVRKEIPCSLVQDLLPLYVEDLTSEESSEYIEAHLKDCDFCKESLEKLQKELIPEVVFESKEEIDYLKKVKRTNRKKLIFGILGTSFFLVAILCFKLYVLGFETTTYSSQIEVISGEIHIQGKILDSNLVYSRYKIMDTSEGEKVVVFGVLPSLWNKEKTFLFEEPLPESGTLYMNGTSVNEKGKIVSKMGNTLFSQKNPYIGDVSANSELAQTLRIATNLGTFTNSLQTKEEPYGWTFEFTKEISKSDEATYNQQMKKYATMLMSLIDNLGEVSWTYLCEGERVTKSWSLRESDSSLGENTKSFSESPMKVQELLDTLGIYD